MDKFKALEPVRLHQEPLSAASGKPNRPPPPPTGPLVGRLPQHLYLVILDFLPVPDIPAYARTCRVLSRFASSEEVWRPRYGRLLIEKNDLAGVLDGLEATAKGTKERERAQAPPTLDVADDEFGDFATANLSTSNPVELFPSTAPDELGDFVGGSSLSFSTSVPSKPPIVTSRSQYIRVHSLLKPLTPALLDPPHQILSNLFSASQVQLHDQAKTLHLLFLFLAPEIAPLRNASVLLVGLRAAADRFDAALLTTFEAADGRADENEMRRAAEASWEVWTASRRAALPSSMSSYGASAEWEMGRVWAEKREIFYTTSEYKPQDNFTYVIHYTVPHDSTTSLLTSV
jgi:recyclin-1